MENFIYLNRYIKGRAVTYYPNKVCYIVLKILTLVLLKNFIFYISNHCDGGKRHGIIFGIECNSIPPGSRFYIVRFYF